MKELRRIRELINEALITLSLISFSLGFALFVSSVIKLIEFRNPWISLFLGLFMMIIPVIFGIWEFKHLKKKTIHNFKKLKVS